MAGSPRRGPDRGWRVLHLADDLPPYGAAGPIQTADAERVRALLPTDELHPVLLPNGRALVGLSAARYHEGTAEGMDLHTSARGRISVDRSPMIVYSARGGELLEAVCPCSGIVQQAMGRGAGRLELGDHPVADELRALGVSPEPFLARCYLNLRIHITAPRVVGTARPFTVYAGRDADGNCTIRYPGGSEIDLHAITPPPVARERVAAS